MSRHVGAIEVLMGGGGRLPNILAISERQVATLRLFLALTSLLAVLIDPSEPESLVRPTYVALTLYALYSLGVALWTARSEKLSNRSRVFQVWLDLSLYTILILATGGSRSAFFFLYFYVVLSACSLLGPRYGRIVMFAAVITSFSIGYMSLADADRQWNRLLLRPTSLFAIGSFLTYWAEAEQRLRKRLELLSEVSLTSNPRFGVDRTTAVQMRRILEFFDADNCVILGFERDAEDYPMRCATRRNPEAGFNVYEAPGTLRRLLSSMANLGATVFSVDERSSGSRNFSWDPETLLQIKQSPDVMIAITEWLECNSFMAVPMRHYEWTRGYLMVGTSRRRAYRVDDGRFLLQLADQITPILEHIRLVDRMASGAADEERRRIARNVHDRIIQPYIGLHIGLNSLKRRLASLLARSDSSVPFESQAVLDSLNRLDAMASEGVADLRRYINNLRSETVRGDALVDSILRYAAKFEAATGIRVRVIDRLEGDDIHDRLAAEIFQMAAEALSNVRKHTSTTAVSLTLERSATGNIAMRVENEAKKSEERVPFIPRSITERARSLGGQAQVVNGGQSTVVKIDIPR